MKHKHYIYVAIVIINLVVSFSDARGQNNTAEEIRRKMDIVTTGKKQGQATRGKSSSNTSYTKLKEENKQLHNTIDSLSNIIKEYRNEAEKAHEEAKAKANADSIAKSNKINTYIKDSVFLDYLLSYCDVDNDGKLTQWDAEHTYIIDIGIDKSHSNISGSFNQITSIDGIDKFINLKYLVCSGNPIKKIDLSKNEQLETLIANKCGLRELNVSNNENLTRLECNNNSIYLIDLKNNPNLLSLDISKNHISSIDISECTKIKTIDCSDNMMTGTLSFPRNKSLVRINCSRNNLSAIDVKECIEIKYIDCRKNKKLETIRIAKDNKDIPIEMPHSTSKKSE